MEDDRRDGRGHFETRSELRDDPRMGGRLVYTLAFDSDRPAADDSRPLSYASSNHAETGPGSGISCAASLSGTGPERSAWAVEI